MLSESAGQGVNTALRESGIEILGDLRWGSHFCNFYDSKEDLLQILVPYFKAGLQGNEFCLWITSDPVSIDDAYQALRDEIQDFEIYFQKQQITILSHVDWYLSDNVFVPDIVINGWFQKLRKSLNSGFEGMRVSGNEAWLERDVWKNFIDYERSLNDSLKDQRMIVLCTYPLAKCDAHAVFDVSQVHDIAVTKRKGHWEVVEAPALKQTKSQLDRSNKELESQVAERVKELTLINAELEKEIEQHKITQGRLLQIEAKVRSIFDATDTAYVLLESDLSTQLFNQRAADFVQKVFGWSLRSGDNILDFLTSERQVLFMERVRKAIGGEQISYETNFKLKDKISLWYHVRLFPIMKSGSDIFGLVLALTNITDRKLLEGRLEKERLQKQRAITNAVITAEENQRQIIGRELHDNINQILASARLFLSMISTKDISESGYSYVERTNQMILNAIDEIRTLSHSMITPFTENKSLREAIEKIVSIVASTSTIKISFEVEGLDEDKLSEKLRLNLYRMIQEQFNNILKHAKANAVTLKIFQDTGKIILSVTDDGIGVDMSKNKAGIGLMNIKARASLFDGEVNAVSSPGNGFELYVKIKLV